MIAKLALFGFVAGFLAALWGIGRILADVLQSQRRVPVWTNDAGEQVIVVPRLR